MGLFDWLLGRSTPPTRAVDHLEDAAAGSASSSQDQEDDQGTAALHSEAKDRMMFPRPKFQGEFTPENLAFDSNLQEFAQRVVYICSLENSGKISPDEAHRQIRDLYKELSRSHKGLKIADS